ncbi:MAG: hypothetical protein ABIR12_04310 [Ilumatobacteraceae bacterium]
MSDPADPASAASTASAADIASVASALARRWLAAEPDEDMRLELAELLSGSVRRLSTDSPVGCNSAPPDCVAQWAPGRSG